MQPNLNITSKLTLVFVLFATALVLTVGVLAYNTGKNALYQAATSELMAASFEKEVTFNQWMEDHQLQLVSLSHSSEMIEQTIALSAAATSAEADRAHDRLVAQLEPWIETGQFQDLLLIEIKAGRVIVATNPVDEGKFKETRSYFIQGQKAPYIEPPYYSLALQAPSVTVSTPLYAADGRLLAVLAGRLDMGDLNEIIQRQTGIRQTSDAYLINTASLFVTQPRFINDPAIWRRGLHTEITDACLAGGDGVLLADDYQGIPVIATYRWLPDHQLCLVVKLHQAEALAPIQTLGLTITLISGLAILIATALAVALARTITRPVLALQQGVMQFTQGERNLRLPETSRDELGLLAYEFNQMAVALEEQENQLRLYTTGLETRVEERALALAASEKRFRLVIESMPNAIVVVDETGKITLVNAQTETLFGYNRGELIGQRVEILIPERIHPHHSGYRASFMANPETRPMGQGRDLYGLRKDGHEVPVEIGLSPMENEEGLFILSVITDITKRKQIEEQVKQQADELARSNADLEQFAYVASHDLQEPLRMVSSYLQLLQRRYKNQLGDDAHEFITFAVDGATRMKALINDLLAYSRVESRGKTYKSVACEEILERVLLNLNLAIDESGAIITHDPLPEIKADETQLHQLFQNLISNALKFRREAPPRICINVKRAETQWVFSFQDNGIGFEQQFADRIFVIFQRLHSREEYAGTGIGLAICKKIVERHGGRMWVESEPGQGSTFYFTLPMKKEDNERSANG